MVLGKRGMSRVHLVDADRELGGSLRWTTQLPGLGEWGRLTNYRAIQIEKLRNVTFVPGRTLSAADVLEYGAEIVVVATGSRWSRLDGTGRAIRGSDRPTVFTPEQVILDPSILPAGRVLIYDIDGYFMGPSLAQMLGETRPVILVTTMPVVGPYTEYTLEAPRFHQRLHRLGIELVTGHAVTEIRDGVVDGYGLHDAPDRAAATWSVDAVVLVTQRMAADGLYRELRLGPDQLHEAGIEAVHLIGDAHAPRVIADAIFDGHRLAREIDEANPHLPRPYLRERPSPGPALPVVDLAAVSEARSR